MTSVSERSQTHARLNNGASMPLLGLGTWRSTQGVVGEAVKHAIKEGYRLIDCAKAYGNEKEVGEAITSVINDGLVKREELWITSKLWNSDHHRVREAYQETCKNLGVEYLDLYLVHWPVTPKAGDSLDPPYQQTWRDMEKLAQERLVKTIGVSNMSIRKLQELLSYANVKPAINQVESHPYFRNDDLIAFCKQQDIHVTAYSPLGSGSDMDNLINAFPSLFRNPVVQKVSKELGRDPGQVLLRWNLQRGNSVIAKSASTEHIKANLQVFDFEIPEPAYMELSSFQTQLRVVDGSAFLYPLSSWRSLTDLWDDPHEDERLRSYAQTLYKKCDAQPKLKLKSGLEIPQVAFDAEAGAGTLINHAVMHAVRQGYRHVHISSAMVQDGKAADVAQGLKQIVWEGVVPRKDLWVTCQLPYGDGFDADNMTDGIRGILEKVQIEYLDLALLRVPPYRDGSQLKHDAKVHDAWHALQALAGPEGPVRSVGKAGLKREGLHALVQNAKTMPDVIEVDSYDALDIECCKEKDIVPMVVAGDTAKVAQAVENKPEAQTVAEESHHSVPQVALCYMLQRRCVVAVQEACPEHVMLGAEVCLLEEQMRRLSSVLEPEKCCVGAPSA